MDSSALRPCVKHRASFQSLLGGGKLNKAHTGIHSILKIPRLKSETLKVKKLAHEAADGGYPVPLVEANRHDQQLFFVAFGFAVHHQNKRRKTYIVCKQSTDLTYGLKQLRT